MHLKREDACIFGSWILPFLIKRIRQFSIVCLKGGFIPFDKYTFRYWNTKKNGWAVEEGTYTVSVGSSVADIRLMETLAVEGEETSAQYDEKKLEAYRRGEIHDIPDEAFAELLGGPIPDGSWKGRLDRNDAICQLVNAKSRLARFILKQLEKKKKAAEAAGRPDLNVLFICNMPFRAISKMTAGAVDGKMVEGMVDVVNGHFFVGAGKIISGYFTNRHENRKYAKLLQGHEKPRVI